MDRVKPKFVHSSTTELTSKAQNVANNLQPTLSALQPRSLHTGVRGQCLHGGTVTQSPHKDDWGEQCVHSNTMPEVCSFSLVGPQGC